MSDGGPAVTPWAWPVSDHRVLNLFQHLTNTFGVLPGDRTQSSAHEASLSNSTLISRTNSVSVQTEQMEREVMERAEREIADTSESIALDLLWNIDSPLPKKEPNKYCKTMRRVVKDMLETHKYVFKGVVNRLNLDGDNLFSTFVIVSDEIFADGEINWGRIVAVYAFAAKLAMYHKVSSRLTPEEEATYQRKISMFLGKYVAGKLKHWILRKGGWDAFVKAFPDEREFEEKLWRGLVFTAIGFVALGTMVAAR